MKGIHSLLMGYHDLFDCYFQCSFLDISKIVERFCNFQLQYGYCSGSEYYPYYITVQTICCLCFMYRKKNQKNITACKTTKLKMYIHFFFHDSSRKVTKNGEDSVWNIVKKGNTKHVEMKLVISTIILQILQQVFTTENKLFNSPLFRSIEIGTCSKS